MSKEWKMVMLGEVGTIVTGSTPKTSNPENYQTNDIPFYKPGDIQGNSMILPRPENYVSNTALKEIRLLPEKSILVTCIGIIGKVGITPSECATNQQINSIIPNRNVVPEFLAYSLMKNASKLNDMANAPVVPIINKSQFSQFKIDLPSFDVQFQIATTLDKASELISLRKKQLEELDTLAESVFYDMFGDPVKNEKGWRKTLLSNVVEPKSSIKRASRVFNITDKINYIDISSIDNKLNIISNESLFLFGEAPSRAQQKIQKDDILISMVRPNLRNIAKNTMNRNNIVASSGFCVLRATEKINKEYVFYVTKHRDFTNYLVQRVSGANYPAVKECDVLSYNISIPPLPLQTQFASIIEKIEFQKALTKQALQESEDIFQRLMQDLFNPD